MAVVPRAMETTMMGNLTFSFCEGKAKNFELGFCGGMRTQTGALTGRDGRVQ